MKGQTVEGYTRDRNVLWIEPIDTPNEADMAIDDIANDMRDRIKDGLRATYLEANTGGIVEGLEMAALYHDSLADKQLAGAKWDENDNPFNGPALAVVAHRKHAAAIRAMKARPHKPQSPNGSET